MKRKLLGSAALFFGLLVLLTPRFVLPVCEYHGKARMACSYMGWSEMMTGAVMMGAAFAVLMSRTPDALRWLMFVSLCLGLSVIFLPSAIGYCPSYQMPCNYGTVPMLRLLGLITVIYSAVGFVTAGRQAPA